MNYVTLTFGIILGLLFVGVMVFRVLPVADQIVKRERGTVEAMVFTRFCALCIGLPFYVFTIWMTVVILADSAPGISVLQEICGDDYECSSAFAMGRTNHDLAACQSSDCGEENLLARSGSQPLSFPRLGLGKDLSSESETVLYQCVEKVSSMCTVIEEVDGGEGRTCECVENVTTIRGLMCQKYVGCDDDIASSVHTLDVISEFEWNVSTDSAKEFSFYNCACVAENCDTFQCDILTMEYFYPNVFYAGAATILFVLPMMIVLYATLKTQIRKILKCGDMKMYVYSQEAGMQEEYTAENLATGGFTEEQKEKTKYRTFSKKDLAMVVVGPVVIGFFSFMAVLVAGRIGLAFVALAAGVIALYEIVSFVKFDRSRSERLADRKAKNNPHAERNYF